MKGNPDSGIQAEIVCSLSPEFLTLEDEPFRIWNMTDCGGLYSGCVLVIRELKQAATFWNHGRKPEVNISYARTVVSARF